MCPYLAWNGPYPSLDETGNSLGGDEKMRAVAYDGACFPAVFEATDWRPVEVEALGVVTLAAFAADLSCEPLGGLSCLADCLCH